MRMNIMLVDDHEVVRLGLKALLSRYPNFNVVAEAGSAKEAVTKALTYKPDVIVMDIRMPGRSGIEATREIMQKLPDTKILMLTSYAEDEMLYDAISAGAVGYVLKQIGTGDLVRALEAISRGESLIDLALMHKVIGRLRQASRKAEDEAFGRLSEQEVTMLSLIANGKTNKEIARSIYLSEKTVRNYVSVVLSKLNVSTRSEAAAYAVKHHVQDHLSSEP